MKKRMSPGLAIGAVLAVSCVVALALALPMAPAGASLKDEQRALISAKRDALLASQRARQFEHDAQFERDEAQRSRTLAAAVAARIQQAEADIAASQARIAILGRLQSTQRARLAEGQGPIVRLVAALQTMAHRPQILALAQPGSVSDAVHVRALLSSITPVIEQRTAGLRDEVLRGRKLRESAELADRSLSEARVKLQNERLALVRLETEHQARSQRFTQNAMLESDRAIALGEQARDIADLVDKLDRQGAVRTRLASLPGPLLRPGTQAATRLPVERQPARRRMPRYRLPVMGEVVTGMDEISATGLRSKGLTIATARGAQVVAPTRGRVVFAAPYRSFGQIAIIDHGDGMTTLITGMANISVKVGDDVSQGSPIGRAPTERPSITVELRRDGRPVDITPLVS